MLSGRLRDCIEMGGALDICDVRVPGIRSPSASDEHQSYKWRAGYSDRNDFTLHARLWDAGLDDASSWYVLH